MGTKGKTILIILCTFVIGVVLGVALSGKFRTQRLEEIGRMMPQERFLRGMIDIIRPDEDQRGVIEKTLARQFAQIAEIMEDHQSEIATVFDSIRTELQSILTPEQMARLEASRTRPGNRMIEYRVAILAERLGLDEEQIKQITEIYASYESMTGRSFDGRMERRSRSREPDPLTEEIEAILNDEQKAIYHELRARRSERPFMPHRRSPFRRPRENP